MKSEEINEKLKPIENFEKVQLVKYIPGKSKGYAVVLTTAEDDDDREIYFSGMVVFAHGTNFAVGDFSSNFQKDEAFEYHGKLILKND